MNAKRRTYHLEVCPGTSLQGPNDQEIEAAIRGLPGGVPSFLILTKKKNHFMQAGGCAGDGFNFEFMGFSADGLWEHKDSPGGNVDVETVVNAMLSYAKDEETWRDLPWIRLSKEESDARAEKAKLAWEADQPQPGFIRSLIGGFLGAALMELGIISKKKRK